MQVLAGLMSLLAVASVIAYRLCMISQSRVAQDLAGGVQKCLRSRSWKKKLGDPLRDVDDPRLAAAAMMAALAQSDSQISEREEATIMAQMKARFDADDTLAAELLAYARWMVRDVNEPENCFLRVRPVILKTCGQKERAELIQMLTTVAEAGSDTEAQHGIVARLAHTLAA